MAYADSQEYHEAPRITRAVLWIIAINVAIAFLQFTVVRPSDMQGALGFHVNDLASRSWWTIFTYMFVHGGFWHLAFNMYMLWLFGPRIEHRWSAGAFTRFYIWCGLGGWLFHLVFARYGTLVGASGAVYGVLLAYAMHWPDDEVMLFGIVPMKVKWLVAGFIVMDLFFGMMSAGIGSGTAHFAHLGGLAFAWMYMRTPAGKSIDRLRQRVASLPDDPDEPPRAVPRSLPRNRGGERRESEVDEIVAQSKAVMARRNPAPPRPPEPVQPRRRTEAMNLVLDKISSQGIESLSLEERRLLEEMSRELRDD
jgi:membrane associated rhomboid family serine protease